ncbi:flagellar hook-length control protein FliK [Candidatus Caldatribacterium sp.]|uniref:flagellar hook-length control protein FliK n=1 Tax=Candidatus Caldatribacterium sp. TaxID=2282143 RepID=UPI0038416313|nr:flagellar hook-length control protein FliK [Candidatus Caldatribacterium sp.]
MSGFSLPATLFVQEILPGKGTPSLKKDTPPESDGHLGDFSTFLETCCRNAGLFAVPPVVTPTKACSPSTLVEETSPLPCPLNPEGAPSLSCPVSTCQRGEGIEDPLHQFSSLLADALEMVENFTVTLRLGEGNVTVSGARKGDGSFSLSLEGKKETLVAFFTMLFENLRAWFEEGMVGKAAFSQSPQGCGRVLCEEATHPVVEGENGGALETIGGGSSSGEVSSGSGVQNELGTLPLSTQAVHQWEAPDEPKAEEPVEAPSEAKTEERTLFAKVTPLSEEGDATVLFGERSKERVLTPPPKGDATRSDTPSPEESLAPSLFSVKDAKEVEPQETPSVVASVTARDFAEVFEEVLKRVGEVKGRKEVVLHLEPEHLGSITIRLEDQGGKIHCLWEVANPETRELLVKYLPLLEAQLNAQGMLFESFLGKGGNAYAFWGFRWAQAAGKGEDEKTPFAGFEASQVNVLV